LEAINYDTANTVFSFIPNTAETSFYGMLEAAQDELNRQKNQSILDEKEGLTEDRLQEIQAQTIRTEKLAIKDVKLRTFITEDSSRDDLVAHVYDVTYGVVKPDDSIVVIDDSIVRGTTLKKSILKMLDRLNPKQIIVVSSAPQIRYPDCYGIDMARLEHLVAFNAALELHKDRGTYGIVEDIYKKCKAELMKGPKDGEIVNHVKELYAPFSNEELSDKIAKIIEDDNIHAKVKVIFQTVEDLHQACPEHLGDWYFTGDYPTNGGKKVVNRAFVHFMEGNPERAY
jgi:amidophosphoribosyltransferase